MENKNSTRYGETEDPFQEASVWKQQFVVSEESRMQLSSDLMQQKQRVGDLEEELEFLKKTITYYTNESYGTIKRNWQFKSK